MRTCPTFFSAIPVPLATARNGSSAVWSGTFSLSVKRLSDPSKQCTTTGQVYSFVHNVCIQLGRRLFQSGQDCNFNLRNGFLDTMSYLLIGNRYFNREERSSDSVLAPRNLQEAHPVRTKQNQHEF